jgi:hypothetical protein
MATKFADWSDEQIQRMMPGLIRAIFNLEDDMTPKEMTIEQLIARRDELNKIIEKDPGKEPELWEELQEIEYEIFAHESSA